MKYYSFLLLLLFIIAKDHHTPNNTPSNVTNELVSFEIANDPLINACQIAIDPSMFFHPDGSAITENNHASSLADEQAIMGDPIGGSGNNVNSEWYNPWQDNVVAYLDLGQEYDISEIHLFDRSGDGTFQIAPGLPSENNANIIDLFTNRYNEWRAFTGLNLTAVRYLTLKKVTQGGRIAEMAICGTLSSVSGNTGGNTTCNEWVTWVDGCNETNTVFRPGKVGIGMDSLIVSDSTYSLFVQDGILAERVKVDLCSAGGWCDFVFEPGYPLMPLEEVHNYIMDEGHLPNIPSEAELMESKGIDLGQITVKQQEKIEELFLYLIELKREMETLNEVVDELKRENEILRGR